MRRGVYIATPCYAGQIIQRTAMSIAALGQLLTADGWAWHWDGTDAESLIQRGRNTLADMFLKSGLSHLLFVDGDIIFDAHEGKRMIQTGHRVVCGAYPRKNLNWNSIVRALQEGRDPRAAAADYVFNPIADGDYVRTTLDPDAHECIPIAEAATGFLCIQRDVLLDMAAEMPSIWYGSDVPSSRYEPRFAWFDCELSPSPNWWERRYLSEDWVFSRRWRDMGGDIMLDTRVRLGHVGQYTFQGELGDRCRRMEVQLHVPPGLDDVAMRDLQEVAGGAYDLPLEGVDSILDIGANIGAFAAFAAMRWPKAKVTCYEPHPKNFALLSKNAPKADKVMAAVRATEGVEWLREGGPNLGCSSFHDLGLQNEERVSVLVAAANTLPSAQIVKVDTEGCEVEILKGLDLSRTAGVVYEWHRGEDGNELQRLLEAQGFKCIEERIGPRDTGVAKWLR